MVYNYDRNRVRNTLLKSGVVVVMNRKHIRNAGHLITTMKEVYSAGLVAETTFRIDTGILREGMQELVKLRAEAPQDKPFVLGCGSIINPSELSEAVEMGFDMIVAPGNVMGSYGEGREFVRICRAKNIFSAPAVMTPTELQYFLEASDEFQPDAIKVFPANVHGSAGMGGLLAPFVRERHNGRIIMPTGGVNVETGPKFQESISKAGFTPILGMSAPLAYVEKTDKPGDAETIRESLRIFKEKFKPYIA